jgi:hypothetical protein
MADVKTRVERACNSDVIAVLRLADEMMTLASAKIFVLRYPYHPITAALKQVAAMLMVKDSDGR